jgi:hypothetical protein
MYEGVEQNNQKGLKNIVKMGYGHLCLREERTKTKGPEEDRQKMLRPPMSEGGDQDNQRA